MSFEFSPGMFQPAGISASVVFTTSEIATMANELLRKHIETLPVVYGGSITDGPPSLWSISNPGNPSHTARLCDIQEIIKQPCHHEPLDPTAFRSTECKHCGVKMVEKWEAE